MYKRALDADPKHANTLANLAGLLLAGGKSQGLAILDRAFSALKETKQLAGELECAFYLYAHGPAQRHSEALNVARQLICSGTRSPGWDLTTNIERATKDKHPEAPWLKKLASVINDIEPAESLEGWPAWGTATGA